MVDFEREYNILFDVRYWETGQYINSIESISIDGFVGDEKQCVFLFSSPNETYIPETGH